MSRKYIIYFSYAVHSSLIASHPLQIFLGWIFISYFSLYDSPLLDRTLPHRLYRHMTLCIETREDGYRLYPRRTRTPPLYRHRDDIRHVVWFGDSTRYIIDISG